MDNIIGDMDNPLEFAQPEIDPEIDIQETEVVLHEDPRHDADAEQGRGSSVI